MFVFNYFLETNQMCLYCFISYQVYDVYKNGSGGKYSDSTEDVLEDQTLNMFKLYIIQISFISDWLLLYLTSY